VLKSGRHEVQRGFILTREIMAEENILMSL